jgi:hypothetical protein
VRRKYFVQLHPSCFLKHKDSCSTKEGCTLDLKYWDGLASLDDEKLEAEKKEKEGDLW